MAIRVEPGDRNNPQNVMRGHQRVGVMGSRSSVLHQGQRSLGTASTGRIHDCTRPERQYRQIILATEGPSIHDILIGRLHCQSPISGIMEGDFEVSIRAKWEIQVNLTWAMYYLRYGISGPRGAELGHNIDERPRSHAGGKRERKTPAAWRQTPVDAVRLLPPYSAATGATVLDQRSALAIHYRRGRRRGGRRAIAAAPHRARRGFPSDACRPRRGIATSLSPSTNNASERLSRAANSSQSRARRALQGMG